MNITKYNEYIYRTLYEVLHDRANKTPRNKAINYMGIKINYKSFLKLVQKQAQSLDALGVKNNSPVLTMLPNQPENWELMYATNMLGGGYAPLLPTLAPKTLERIISDLEVKNIFIYKDFYEKFRKQFQNSSIENIILMDGAETIPTLLLKLDELMKKLKKETPETIKLKEQIEMLRKQQTHVEPKLTLYKEFIDAGKDRIITPVPFEPNKTAAYITTSGTTGTPKLVEQTNEAFNALALEHMLSVNLDEQDKNLSIMPPSIAYGAGAAHYALTLGFENILIPYLLTNSEKYKELWLKYKPDQFIGGPIHAELMLKTLKETDEKEYDKLLKLYKKAKNIVSGGAPLKKETEQILRELGIKISQGYGDTETLGGTIYNVPETYQPFSAGKPFPFVKVRVCKPGTNEEVKDGEEGELHVITPTLMKRYHNNPEATKETIFINEFGEREHCTGDIVVKKGDFIYFKDRMTDMFWRNGFNVHPSSIKKEIDKYLNVGEECAVIKIEHPDYQCVPVAFISINKDRDFDTLKQEIYQQLKQELDELAVPYEIIKVDEIPHNAGGKVDTKKLIEISGINYCKQKKIER